MLFLMTTLAYSQVLIASKSSTSTAVDPSAILEVKDAQKGFLFPRVALLSPTDNVSVPTPVPGLWAFNSTTNKLNFWENNRWNRNFAIDDGLAVIKLTKNFSGASTASTTISTFPTTVPLFNLNDSTSGWTNLGASTTVVVTKAINSNYIITEGMTQINNTATGQEYQFAIGVFVNGQLKLAKKYTQNGENYACIWKKFNLSGVFDDLPIGTHTIAIYGRNLPKVTSGYTSITYGGNTSNCSNINNDMARIFLTAQITQ